MPDLEAWWAGLRKRSPILDYVGALQERDAEAHGSVLGSAIALRIFLFVVPAAMATSSLVVLLHAQSFFIETLENNPATGDVAEAVQDTGGWDALWLFLLGLGLTAWAGRSLANVLATCSVASWRLPARAARTSTVTVLILSGILFVFLLASAILERLRDAGGAPAWLLSWGAMVGVTGLAWFVIQLVLPREVNDPGSLLPGAVAMGVVQATLQALLRGYVVNRAARTADTYGDLATTIAVLGNFFIIGRMMTASFVLNAVTYERFGSLSQLVFDLPLLRRAPRRYPWLARFFSLTVEERPVG